LGLGAVPSPVRCPQDHVAVALAWPAHRREPLDNVAIERDEVSPVGNGAAIASKAVGVIDIVTIAGNIGASPPSAASYWRFGQFARIAKKVSVIEVHRSCHKCDCSLHKTVPFKTNLSEAIDAEDG
jgi:hypothetical protein